MKETEINSLEIKEDSEIQTNETNESVGLGELVSEIISFKSRYLFTP